MKISKRNWKFKLGLTLVLVSIPFFLALAVIPLLDIESDLKIKLAAIVFILAEVLFYTGGFLLGKELFVKYKSYFNPKNWFKKWKEEISENISSTIDE